MALAVLAVLLASCSNRYPTWSLPSGDQDLGGDGFLPPPPERQIAIRINEVMVDNRTALRDEKGRYVPWVELYNPSDSPIDLCNVPFSGDPADSARWRIPCRPETVVPPRGFLIIFLDGDQDDPSDLHANFTLLPGAPIQLTLDRGAQNFFFYDDLEADSSVGRFPDGGSRILVGPPTPGLPNREAEEPRDAEFVRGDVNGNGLVNVSDLALLSQTISGERILPPCQDRLDANDDGRLDAQDIAFLRDFLFSHGPAPPAPFPAEGTDPTADGLPCTN